MITFSVTAEKFKVFCNQRKGGVKVKDRLANKLTKYFNKNYKEFASASSEVSDSYQEKKRKLRAEFANRKTKKDIEEFNRKSKVFIEEYEINRCEAYTQAYKNGDCNAPIPRVTVRVNSLGPKNLDVYVFEATRDRKTMNYTDPNTRATPTLVYEPMKATITNTDEFDKVFVYLLPDSLSSFNRMTTINNVNFDFSLNKLFTYKLIALGYKGKQAFYTKLASVSSQTYSLSLSPISQDELKNKLSTGKAKVKQEILSDKNFYEAEMINTSREQKYQQDVQLMLEIGFFLFPDVSENCLKGGSEIDYNDFSVVMEIDTLQL